MTTLSVSEDKPAKKHIIHREAEEEEQQQEKEEEDEEDEEEDDREESVTPTEDEQNNNVQQEEPAKKKRKTAKLDTITGVHVKNALRDIKGENCRIAADAIKVLTIANETYLKAVLDKAEEIAFTNPKAQNYIGVNDVIEAVPLITNFFLKHAVCSVIPRPRGRPKKHAELPLSSKETESSPAKLQLGLPKTPLIITPLQKKEESSGEEDVEEDESSEESSDEEDDKLLNIHTTFK